MNLAAAEVSGNTALVAGHTIRLDRGYPALGNGARIEIGVRPEFVEFAGEGEGLPVSVQRVDDLGRVKVVAVQLGDHVVNLIAEEGTAVPADGARIRFDRSRVHVYADGRIVPGEAIGGAA
jgi:glycerol transport system ATP-binding protein